MRCLVTGGAGAVGSNLVRQLQPLSETVVVLDDLCSGLAWNVPQDERVVLVQGRIQDESARRAAFSYGITHVFHLAAFFANQNSVDHPYDDLDTNIVGTLGMLDAAKNAGVERFVYSSSSCVYGSKAGAIAEDAGHDLETPYAISKYTGELYAAYYHRQYDLPTVVLRYFNSYGPGEPPGKYRNVIPNFVSKAMRGEALPIFGTGDETRDFTFVRDTARGTVAAALTPGVGGETFNLGTGRETTIIEIATAINRIFDNPAGIVHLPPRSWDHVKHRRADISKAQRLLGYDPTTSIQEGLTITCEWYDRHRRDLGLPLARLVSVR